MGMASTEREERARRATQTPAGGLGQGGEPPDSGSGSWVCEQSGWWRQRAVEQLEPSSAGRDLV